MTLLLWVRTPETLDVGLFAVEILAVEILAVEILAFDDLSLREVFL